eukprot:gnl/TRDRNA2_/TRDRNA2_129234_c0_seq1.p1 gnl/TRDRNA2_/TRDRNA2_129234_c0~~gnl/TRDRNA2_/TRDRNA2_129234_c0_seq1.p1  ORF type:complete len:155 (-),score=34.89 gnl/TRDRNA2_/TRDRNA2_129234_c0_seq1:10-444(-)
MALSQSLLHPDFRRHGIGNCQVHLMRRKEASKERKRKRTQHEAMICGSEKEAKRNKRASVSLKCDMEAAPTDQERVLRSVEASKRWKDAKVAAPEESHHCDLVAVRRRRKGAKLATAAGEEQELNSANSRKRQKCKDSNSAQRH